MRVLIVDDDPNLRSLSVRVLAEAGHAVRAVADAGAGAAALSAERFDLLLLDLRLARGHGLDVLRAAGRTGAVPRVVIVAGTGDFTRAELFALSPAVAAVLRKPVDIEALLPQVEAAATGDLALLRENGRHPRA